MCSILCSTTHLTYKKTRLPSPKCTQFTPCCIMHSTKQNEVVGEFREKPLEHKDLTAMGRYACTPGQEGEDGTDTETEESSGEGPWVPRPRSLDGGDLRTSPFQAKHPWRQGSSGSIGTKRRATSSTDAILASIRALISIVREKKEEVKIYQTRSKHFIGEAMSLLKQLAGYKDQSSENYQWVLELFEKNPTKLDIFVEFEDNAARAAWLETLRRKEAMSSMLARGSSGCCATRSPLWSTGLSIFIFLQILTGGCVFCGLVSRIWV